MSARNTSGIILIRENTPLPADLAFASEAFLPGWRVVRNIDLFGLNRKIEEAHWNLFYLAGEMKAIVFGHERSGALRRAVKQILSRQEGRKCNSLEITSVASKRFLGIPFLSVKAHSRHIQESLCLSPESEAAATVPLAGIPRTGSESNKPPYTGAKHTREHPVSSFQSSSEI